MCADSENWDVQGPDPRPTQLELLLRKLRSEPIVVHGAWLSVVTIVPPTSFHLLFDISVLQLVSCSLLSVRTHARATAVMAQVQAHDHVQEHEQRRTGGLLGLPTELIHNILLSLPPLCIEHFSQTCKLARNRVYGELKTGDLHLWKQLYLQRFDNLPSLWDAPQPSSKHNDSHDEQNADSSPEKHAVSNVMALVQLRDRAARLYGGDPSNHTPISLNFNAVLTALLSVIDTAVPPQSPDQSLNTVWLSDSILSSGQATWAQWVFPRSIMHSLDEFKSEAAAQTSSKRSTSPQDRKRRRISTANHSSEQNDDSGPSTSAAAAASSRRRSSSKSNRDRPDSVRRRSARLLKLIYPEPLHPLVDAGLDIEALVQPQVRLAARIHCLHGIRAWKASQQTRLTESPQEIPGQSSRDGLANEGAAQASARDSAEDAQTPQAQETDLNRADEAESQEQEEAEDDDDDDDDDEDFDDDESFDEPPAAVLRHRPRVFGPSFGFCNAPDEEDEVRARMRQKVYDSGYYGWSNGYGPLHAWRRPSEPQADDQDDEDEDDTGEDGDGDEDASMADAATGQGSEDGDDDALREAAELSDDDIPDDPIPIEIEVSRNGDARRTFQVADRYGNPISLNQSTGWEASDDEHGQDNDSNQRRTDRAPFQPPDHGTYDAETRTFTYEGALPIGIITGSHNIQVTVGGTVDFVATGSLNVRFVRPGMLAETMRVTSGHDADMTNDEDDDAIPDHNDPVVVELDGDQDDDVDEEDDDDFDEDANDWDDYADVDDDDDGLGHFGMFRPMAAAGGYRGCHANDEIKPLLQQHDADREPSDADDDKQAVSLRRKAIHWELVEAIMVVMYANLKEAIWLENWGFGIKIPKIHDEAGLLTKDPMEKREFLEFPTGWISSLPSPVPEVHVDGATDQTSGKWPSSPPRPNGTASTQDDEKPHDWARCESFWGGTYSFLDFSHFVDYNVRLARRRRQALVNAEASASASSGANGKASMRINQLDQLPKPNLAGLEEAVGDCLQLRLELLPKSQQPAYNEAEEGQADDDEYPTLFFRGTTVTYWGNEAPMPRGGVHGKVRPVYAREEDVDEVMSRCPRGKKKIEGLHWSLTHVYEGEDRWQLEGVQPGPPGTRAPIFGIWTDALHEEESPNGPFVYWMMDERPWKEIERLNREEAVAMAAARAATR